MTIAAKKVSELKKLDIILVDSTRYVVSGLDTRRRRIGEYLTTLHLVRESDLSKCKRIEKPYEGTVVHVGSYKA